MKTRLFENTGGNKFKLLKENQQVSESLVASGLKKVFMNANKGISYNQVECVGLGYIKDVNTAKKVALEEARILAKEYGFKDDENNAKFVKENDFSKLDAQNPSHTQAKVSSNEPTSDETNMGNPEEKREVQIGKEMLSIINSPGMDRVMETEKSKLRSLAEELVEMHGQQ